VTIENGVIAVRAKGRRHAVALPIRSRPEDGIGEALEAIVRLIA
jgi:hypothetical protein